MHREYTEVTATRSPACSPHAKIKTATTATAPGCMKFWLTMSVCSVTGSSVTTVSVGAGVLLPDFLAVVAGAASVSPRSTSKPAISITTRRQFHSISQSVKSWHEKEQLILDHLLLCCIVQVSTNLEQGFRTALALTNIKTHL